jgi:hypothetical protein
LVTFHFPSSEAENGSIVAGAGRDPPCERAIFRGFRNHPPPHCCAIGTQIRRSRRRRSGVTRGLCWNFLQPAARRPDRIVAGTWINAARAAQPLTLP